MKPPLDQCGANLRTCLGYCERKPRKGFGTCWQHRDQERTIGAQKQAIRDSLAAIPVHYQEVLLSEEGAAILEEMRNKDYRRT